MTFYLAGPMSGRPDLNYPAFNAAALLLRAMGHVVFNPAETFAQHGTLPKEVYMNIDLVAVSQCDSIMLLDGWKESDGAMIEFGCAVRHGKGISELRDFVPRIIGLCGYAGSGKDEVGKILLSHGFERRAFADKLKVIAASLGWNGLKDEQGRRFLQDVGVTLREQIGLDVWRRKLFEDHISGPIVITDARFQNEIDAIHAMCGQIWKVERPGTGPANDHVSEHEWNREENFDAVIVNSGTLEDLSRVVIDALEDEVRV